MKETKELLNRIITCDYRGKEDKKEILKKLLKRKYRRYLKEKTNERNTVQYGLSHESR